MTDPEFGTPEWTENLLAELTDSTVETLRPFVERLDATEQVAISSAKFIGDIVAAISALATVVIEAGMISAEDFEGLVQHISEQQEEQAVIEAMEQEVTGSVPGDLS